MASVISNKQYRRTISLLAQESNQYAREIWGQINTIGGGDLNAPEDCHDDTNQTGAEETRNEGDTLLYCMECEKEIIKAYRDVLNEPFLMEGLRSIMRYQLNGIMYAFLQLKLLGATLR